MNRRDPLSVLPEPGAPDSMYVLDLSGFVWRFVKAPGQSPYAALGFVKLVRRVLRDRRPARLVVVRDNPHPTFRHELMRAHSVVLGSEGYKEAREAKRDPVEKARALEQCRLAEEMLGDVYGLSCHTRRGYEADDLVASFAQAGLDDGLRVVVVCHDKDMLQLVTTDSDRCVAWDSKYKVTDALGVEAKFGRGVFPNRVAEFLAIVGDATDGFKGVVGAGEVAAQKVINAFPTLEDALVAAEAGDLAHPFWKAEPKLWAKVVHQQEAARLCLKLATLVRNLPLGTTLDQVALETSGAVQAALADTADEAEEEAG